MTTAEEAWQPWEKLEHELVKRTLPLGLNLVPGGFAVVAGPDGRPHLQLMFQVDMDRALNPENNVEEEDESRTQDLMQIQGMIDATREQEARDRALKYLRGNDNEDNDTDASGC